MPETKLILHVGRGKTGSSSIQQLLRSNRDRLAERGFLYPAPPAEDNGGLGDADANGFWLLGRLDQPVANAWPGETYGERGSLILHHFDRWLGQQPRGRALIVSNEGFWGLGPPVLAALKAVAERHGYDVAIHAYLREQVDHLASAYCQQVRKGRCAESIAAFVASRAANLAYGTYADEDGSDYDAILTKFETVFGRDRMCVGVYEREKLTGGDVRTDFLARLGIDRAGLDLGERANESAGYIEVEAARLLRTVHDLPVPNLRRLSHLARKIGIDHDPDFIWRACSEDVATIRAFYEAGNARVRDRYVGGAEPLFAMKRPSRAEADPMQDIVRVIVTYFRRYPDALARAKS